MDTFLQQVARHYIESGDAGAYLFIFPNRRSQVFFSRFFGGLLKSRGKDTLLPRMNTVGEFYGKASGKVAADRITLLKLLYEEYAKLHANAEQFDDFIYWGDVLLGDFGDIDRYIIDAEDLFFNIRDLKNIENNLAAYTDEQQRAAIEKLLGHFTTENWKNGGGNPKDAKVKFLSIWSILYDLYHNFKERLSAEGLAYDGMIYRDIAERAASCGVVPILSEVFPDVGKYVFIGFNVLSSSEEFVMAKMRDAGIAEFCWDWCGDLLTNKSNIAGKIMRRNVEKFRNAFVPEGGTRPEVISISVSSATGQAKLIQGIVDKIPADERGLDTAVILPDESMLMAVLNSIPQSVDKVNVTMGCPLATSEWNILMRDIVALQIHMREKDGKQFFFHRQVYDILSSGILKNLFSGKETGNIRRICKDAKYYIPMEDFMVSGLLGIIFRPAAELEEYLLEVTENIAVRMEDDLQRGFAMEYYKCVNRLRELNLGDIKIQTRAKLLERLVQGVSVPFEGEPLGGLQVMGMLETRALDFKNVIILNAEEGSFPRRSISASFIPPELRKAFGLPTQERQDIVWSYYFYRLICRAQKVWMLYDSRTEGLSSGEESRFIKQLRYLYADKCNFHQKVAVAEVSPPEDGIAIPKNEDDVEKMRNLCYSASSIQRYISCPAKFYYADIKGLRPESEVKESMDAGLMGTVCHETLEHIYSRGEGHEHFKGGTLSKAYLESWKAGEHAIREKVYERIRAHLHSIEISGRDLVTAEIVVKFVQQVIQRDLELMPGDSIHIHKVEMEVLGIIAGHKFRGFIDRLDDGGNGSIRIVDYKSGSDKQDALDLDAKDIEKIFKGKDTRTYKATLQFFIYDCLLRQTEGFKDLDISNTMYSIGDIFKKTPKTRRYMYECFGKMMEERLKALFEEMENANIPFTRAESGFNSPCEMCDYKILCGKK